MVTLTVDGVEYRNGDQSVFSDISLSINSGKVISVIGKNGAGKSTLIKCINHILSPHRGTVLIDGNDVAHMAQRKRALRFSYLSQKSEQLFPSTVFDVVLTGRYPHSPLKYTRRDEEITAGVLAMMELDAFAGRQYNHLSGGEQQQVLIARALAQEADVLLFDEPTNNLDLQHQLRIMELIQKLSHERNIISILAIHELNFAASYSDRVIVLHDGKIVANGNPMAVFTADMVNEAFGVPVKIYYHHGAPHIALLPG